MILSTISVISAFMFKSWGLWGWLVVSNELVVSILFLNNVRKMK